MNSGKSTKSLRFSSGKMMQSTPDRLAYNNTKTLVKLSDYMSILELVQLTDICMYTFIMHNTSTMGNY